MAGAVERKPADRAKQTGVANVSSDERRARGKALRQTVPRASHAGWNRQKSRRDSVEILAGCGQARVRKPRLCESNRSSSLPMAPVPPTTRIMGVNGVTWY